MSDLRITKTDTGGRTMGRIVSYIATDAAGQIVAQHETLRGLRTLLALMEEAATAEATAHRDEITALLMGGK